MDTTTKNEMDRKKYRVELAKCLLETFIFYVFAYVGANVLVNMAVFNMKDYGPPFYAAMITGILFALFGLAMGFRLIVLAYRLLSKSSINTNLERIKNGGATPRQKQKKWRKNSIIFAVIGLILLVIIMLLISNPISCGGKPDDSWDICSKCSGVGKIRNEYDFIIKCPRCNGVGLVP